MNRRTAAAPPLRIVVTLAPRVNACSGKVSTSLYGRENQQVKNLGFGTHGPLRSSPLPDPSVRGESIEETSGSRKGMPWAL